MNLKRQKQIESAAKALLQKTGHYPTNFYELPSDKQGIDVKTVAEKIGIEVREYDFGEDVSGVLLQLNGKVQIGYAPENRTGKKRQRFTIAHEIGHYVLEHQRKGVFIDTPEKYFALYRNANSSTGEDMQEREANAFAASLLMPLDLVREGVTHYMSSDITRKQDFELVPNLASDFNVSNIAMSIRLTNLNLLW
ncbi:ImmA/IrrE family metallo-endopeptidase [Spirosoma rhododendri]|uniref:ImmA/IrrE family metallo-endopeptidase n=1 Tax=Spirosoma rhododendri TaxID=2728024 RepID=A0A7L5DJ37_9BACT|nr:ImmA/IrrE family metallo-endopeptidase [Spirosoma rhododendri]QJD77123.1 ImmA/IrrE family metallo-endopeptidase [Spirosoma rhododendri]